MQKLACVFSFQESSWVSCQKIVFNLHEAWSKNKNFELANFNFGLDTTHYQSQLLAADIVAYEPDTIVILDHRPHPLFFFETLVRLLGNKKKPKILFHVFGDFTLNYASWSKLGLLLQDFEVKFLVASERQKKLIDLFLVAPMTSEVCPFPVNSKEFSYSKDLRGSQRAEWKIGEKDIALVFTGRLSRQKRIHSLLTYFSETLEDTKADNLHLFLYGNPDHIADPFLGKWETEGEYFRKIYKLYEKFPPHTQAKIHFMGGVPNSELKSVYHGADYLMNLSVHNDEDFGMSVAEAQCCGLPSVLTDWGGLAGFARPEMPDATRYVPVRIGIKTKVLSSVAVKAEIKRILENKNVADRKKLASLAEAALSVEAASKILTHIYEGPWQKFAAFSDFFEDTVLQTTFSALPYLTDSRKLNSLYREIYSSYVRND
jgi:glycosyltransferase involved in cell wall biosynthesis